MYKARGLMTHLKQQISLFNRITGLGYDICSIICKALLAIEQ